MGDLYECVDGQAEAPRCKVCDQYCSTLLAILVPAEGFRRHGYRYQRRYVFQCGLCFSTVIMMQARSGMLYRVHA